MMRKKNLFHLIKGFFLPEVDQEQENINIKKKGRWLLFRRLKARKRPASILAALSAPSKSDAEEVHHGFEASAHVGSVVPAATEPVDVDSAEAAAGEVAAVLAASSQSMNPEDSESSDGGVGLCSCHKNHPEDLAAIKIQTAFRGYLARKALRALKGLVRLQAIIRGRAVRRRAMTTLKCLQSIVDIQSRICARRCQMVQSRHLLDDKLKMQVSSEGRMDDRLLTKDEANAISLGKKEAMFRRERLKAYSFNHRSSTESEDERTDGRLNYWLEQHITNAQMPRKEELKKADTNGRKQLRLRNFQRQNCIEDYEHNDPPLLLHRRSLQYHKNRRSVGEDSYFQTSPKFPTYMAATESAKARARRAGSPSLRPKMYSDAYSDGDSPYKHKLSPMSSINSEATVGVYSSQQRSPGLKGLSLRVRSNRSFKDISLESESSLLNWDRHNAFR